MEVQNLKVCDITPSAMNPRKTFDKDSLAELAENIKNQGLLQPITVRPIPEEASVKINKDGSTSEFKYEIVCGERRFRACKMLTRWRRLLPSMSCSSTDRVLLISPSGLDGVSVS